MNILGELVTAFKRTVNIHVGNKLSGKSHDEVLEAVVSLFGEQNISAVQQSVDVPRITFKTEALALNALQNKGVRLFGLWCRMDGGPPVTIIHLFDFRFEGSGYDAIKEFFGKYGQVRDVRLQRYLRHSNIYTGTRLVDVVLDKFPPRLVSINTHVCRVWFKGQPLICNICGTEGHKSVDCPDRDKCRRCGEHGHMARTCQNAWGTNPPPPAGDTEAPVPPQPDAVDEASSSGSDAAVGAGSSSQASVPEVSFSASGSGQESNIVGSDAVPEAPALALPVPVLGFLDADPESMETEGGTNVEKPDTVGACVSVDNAGGVVENAGGADGASTSVSTEPSQSDPGPVPLQPETNTDAAIVDVVLPVVDRTVLSGEVLPGSLGSSPDIGDFSSAESLFLSQASSCSISHFTEDGQEIVEVLEEGCSQPAPSGSSTLVRKSDRRSNVSPSDLVRSLRRSTSSLISRKRVGTATGKTSTKSSGSSHSKMPKVVSDRPSK